MAIGLVGSIQGWAGVGGDGFTSTDTMNSTGANFLVGAMCELGAADGTFGDSFGNTYTPLTQRNEGGTPTRFIRLWYCANPAGLGSGHAIVVTATDTWPGAVLGAFSGVATSSPLDQQNGGGTPFSNTLATGSITAADGSLVVSAIGRNPHGTPHTISDGLTVIEDIANTDFGHLDCALAWKEHTTGAINPTWTSPDSATLVAAIASFLAGAAPPSAGLERAKNRGIRPHPFKPMGDAFRPAPFKGWR